MDHNPNLLTGDCLDCGATREEIIDCVAEPCVPIAGPNRLAIAQLRGRYRQGQIAINDFRRRLARAETTAVEISREVRAMEARNRELGQSIVALGGEIPKEISEHGRDGAE